MKLIKVFLPQNPLNVNKKKTKETYFYLYLFLTPFETPNRDLLQTKIFTPKSIYI